MRSAAVAGLCRVSTNRVVLFVLCPYKVMPRDRRKVAVCRANPSLGGGVGDRGRSPVCAPRPRPTGSGHHWPRGPAAVGSPGRMHTGPGPLGHFTKTTVTVLPQLREYVFTSSSWQRHQQRPFEFSTFSQVNISRPFCYFFRSFLIFTIVIWKKKLKKKLIIEILSKTRMIKFSSPTGRPIRKPRRPVDAFSGESSRPDPP